MAISPTQRSLKMLRDEGWIVSVTEHWLVIPGHPGGGIRKDLFGFGDLLALKDGEPPMIVQTTSGANTAARLTKIRGLPEASLAVRCGFIVRVHGWRQLIVGRTKEGKAKRAWVCKEEDFNPYRLPEVEVEHGLS